MQVAIVTPTIGSEHHKQCIDRVQAQTYKDLKHYIFIDGIDVKNKCNDPDLPECWPSYINNLPNVKQISLDENVGKGWYGHRVYAACSFLVNADIICYLDEDNWLQPNHVQSIVDTFKRGYDWVYSLRNINDKDGNFICEDNCESLGHWPVYFNDGVFHIDTACFAIRRDVAIRIGHAWYGQWGADRQFFNAIKQQYKNYGCTGEYTANYRLDGNPNSVKKEFFEEGNAKMKQKYPNGYPWLGKNKLVEVAPGVKIIMKDFE